MVLATAVATENGGMEHHHRLEKLVTVIHRVDRQVAAAACHGIPDEELHLGLQERGVLEKDATMAAAEDALAIVLQMREVCSSNAVGCISSGNEAVFVEEAQQGRNMMMACAKALKEPMVMDEAAASAPVLADEGDVEKAGGVRRKTNEHLKDDVVHERGHGTAHLTS